MALTIKHNFTSAKSDLPTPPGRVPPSAWNDNHAISLNPQKLVGKDGSGAGAATEIGVTSPLKFDGSSNLELDTSGATPGPYTNANITVDQYGRVTAVANGTTTGGANASSDYILDAADATLPNARVTTDATAITWNKAVAGQIKAILGQFTGDVTNASADSLALTIGGHKVTLAKIAQGTALSVLGVTGGSTADYADIVAAADDRLLSRTSSAIGFTQLTVGMFPANVVTLAKIAQGTALSVLGVTGNATANYADIVGTTDQVLRVNTAGTAVGFGTIATGGITAAAVTYAKIQNVAGLSVMGRSTNSSGVAADITGTDGQVLRVSGTALGFGTVVTAGLADANVTYAKIQNVAALSVFGRSANSSGVGADITGTDGQALRVSGTALGFGTLATAAYADASVTYAKIANVAGLSVMGRSANSSGVPADITGTDGQVLRVSGTALGFGTIATAGIAASAVTLAKIANGTALSVLGVAGNAGAAYADIAAGSDKQVLCRAGTAIAFGAIDLTSSAAATGVLQAACVPVLSGATVCAGGTASTTSTIDLVVVIGDGTNVITTGLNGVYSPVFDFAATIVAWSITAKQSGSVSIDVWKTTYSSFDAGSTHPVAADKISASAPITFSTATKAQDSTLTGWTKSISSQDILGFNVASVTTCTQVTITLKLTKTS